MFLTMLLTIVGAHVQSAAAATFAKAEPATICSIRMRGLVSPGDVQAFTSALQDVSTSKEVSICLDSAGGSFNGALAIVREIAKLPRVRTVIEKGAECYSACALIFMAGHRSSQEHRANRWIHPLGRLGFHAPYIKPATGTYDPAVYMRAHIEALRAVQRLLEMGDGKIYPDELVIAMLRQGPNKFLSLDTLRQARRWSIDIFDFSEPLPLSQAKLQQACINNFGWSEKWDEDSNWPVNAPKKPLRPPQNTIVNFDSYGDEGAFTCHAAVSWNKKRVAIDVYLDESERTGQKDFDKFLDKIDASKDIWDASTTPLWHVLPPPTKLVDIAVKADRPR